MRIREKLFFSFIFIVLSAGAIGYFWIGGLAQGAIRESIGRSAVLLSQEALDKIDIAIYGYADGWRSFFYSPRTKSGLATLEDDFIKRADGNIKAYITQEDQKWISAGDNEITPFMQQLIGNSFSREIRDRMAYYEQEEGHSVFNEVLVTNEFGANLAESGKTTDYDQADEEWWKKAKEHGFYMEDVSYDPSTQTYSVNIALGINDDKGNFLGAVKIALNIREVIDIIKDLENTAKEGQSGIRGSNLPASAHFILATRAGKIIYATKQFAFGEDINATILSKFSGGKDYVVTKDKRVRPALEELFARASSRGYKDFVGLSWTLVTHYDTSEVFQLVYQLRTLIIYIVVGITLLFIFITRIISSRIVNSIDKLRRGIDIVERGNLNYRVGTSTKDEIGQVSRAFDKMTSSLKKSWAEVDKKVKKQTEEIRQANAGLADQQKALLNVLDDVRRERDNVVREKGRVDTILYSIGDGVFVLNEYRQIILFNKMASEISGFSLEEVMGRKYDEVLKFVDEKDNKVNDKFVRDAMQKGEIATMANHTVLLAKDGRRVPVADSAAPLKDARGRITGCVVVFRDVTREREVDKIKTDFVSIASHQLRTPLVGIQWTVERILKVGKPSKKNRGYFEDIRSSIKRLSNLVTDLLNVSRLEEGNIAVLPEEIELVKFLNDRLNDYASLAEKKKINVDFKEHPPKLDVLTDRNLLQNIFQSLISNAIEYTNEMGRVRIVLKEKGDNFLLSISDNGIGIPKEAWPKIFEKFTRADNAKVYKPSGSGLGLYLARAATLTLDGKIWFETEENKGTTFFVEIPIKAKSKLGMKGFI
jgi:PAS domain S-box-containing protein